MKTHTLEEVTDRIIGVKGTPERDKFDNELRLEILAHKLKEIRKSRNMSQEQLGELVGIKKSQISKIENSFTNARFDTIMRIFNALGVKVHFDIELT